jgi:hypothetical protein
MRELYAGKIVSQRLHIQEVKLELEKEVDIVLKDNEEKVARKNRKNMLDKSFITLVQEEDCCECD